MKKIWITRIIIVIIALAAPIYLRTILEAKNHLKNGDRYRENGNYVQAVRRYKMAARYDSPFNGYAKEARQKHYELATTKFKDPKTEREALRELRGTFLATRSFLRSEREENRSELLVKTEKELDKFQAPERANGYIEQTEKYEANYFWQLLAQLGFWSWIIAIVLIIVKGFTPEGRFNLGKVKSGVALLVSGYILWLTSLALA